MDILTGYKIVDTSLQSLTKATGEQLVGVKYIENQWVEPKNPELPLFVFDTLPKAFSFIERFGEEKTFLIYRCHYLPSKIKLNFFCSMNYVENLLLKKERDEERYGGEQKIFWPPGTVFADKVKLLEIIYHSSEEDKEEKENK